MKRRNYLGFNSILVRLDIERNARIEEESQRASFNSILVRLDIESNRARLPARIQQERF